MLGRPVSGASLAALRIAIGLVMSLEAWSLFRPDSAAISTGATPLQTYYTGADIRFHFPYEPFQWLPLFPPGVIHALVMIMGVAGVLMAIGLFYRASAATVFLIWFYLFVVESTRTYWQSHYYLEALLTFLMICVPAGQKWSLDARVFKRPTTHPGLVPFWPIFLIRGQLVIAYFYAGVAKLNVDWLLDAVPVRWFLAAPGVTRPFEGFLSSGQLEVFKGFLRSEGLAYFISYSGAAFDLTVGLLFLIRRTRYFALAMMVIFHATNHFLIFDDIGWFPLVGVATALIFLEPDWPERFVAWIRQPRISRPNWQWAVPGAILFPIVGLFLGWKARPGESLAPGALSPPQWVVRGIVLWLVWQGLFPLRHYFIPGDGRFTFEGLSFSWRLKTDRRHAVGHQLYIHDERILSGAPVSNGGVNWAEWHGERVVYRNIDAGRIRWNELPEILILLEPLLGERIIYNPLGAPVPIKTEVEARQRFNQLWQNLYDRAPDSLVGAYSLSEGLRVAASSWTGQKSPVEISRLGELGQWLSQSPQGQKAAEISKNLPEIQRVVGALFQKDRQQALRSSFKNLQPLCLQGEFLEGAPFLSVEDRGLLPQSGGAVIRSKWRGGTATRPRVSPQSIADSGEPLIVYLGGVGPEAKDLLPQASIFDAQERPSSPPYIWWNSLKDLTVSKYNHSSNQAFYLRRYARRIAALWDAEYHRRPKIQAVTAVSFNGRSYQSLVDPIADLASVPVRWMGHNSWIRDLEEKRIPHESLSKAENMGIKTP